MAAVLRLCVLLSLAVSQGGAATAHSSDETCLVQRQVLGRSSIIEEASKLVQAFADKFKPPHDFSGIHEFLNKISLDKLVSFGTDLLRMAKNKTVMDMLHQELQEATDMLTDYAEDLSASAATLTEVIKSPTDEDASLALLKSFMMGQSKDIARIGSHVLVTARDTIKRLPDGPLRNGSLPFLAQLDPFTKKTLNNYIYGDLLEDSINHMFAHQSRFCEMFMPVHSNFSYIDRLLNEKGQGLFEQAKSMLTPLMPLIESLDGDAAPAISHFLETTLDNAEGVIKELGVSFHKAVVAMGDCATKRVHCKVRQPAPVVMQSAAAGPARWLAAVAAVAAAWAAVLA